MNKPVQRSTAQERDVWATELLEEQLVGGASFSGWATLMSYEAHQCFVAGADIATVIVCSNCCETYLRTEAEDYDANFSRLIDSSGLHEELTDALHSLRKLRNTWAHALMSKRADEPQCYTEVYTEELEKDAKEAYRTMAELLFLNPVI